MNSKQFAWLYVVENGIAGKKPSFYGGYKYDEETRVRFPNVDKNSWIYPPDTTVHDTFIKDLKTIGVDWEKTKPPTSSFVSEFNGTFNEASTKEYLEGIIILKDGSKQNWIADKLEVSNAFDMMEQVSEAGLKYEKIFKTLY